MRRGLGLIFGAACALGAAWPAMASEAVTPAAVIKNYADLAEAMYGDAFAGGEALRAAVRALLDEPSPRTLAAARIAWKAARNVYVPTEGFRFGNKVVDDWEGNVNAWPVDEGLIDYVDVKSYGESKEDNPLFTANVIARRKLQLGSEQVNTSKIDKKLLRKLHQALEVEANVATGYHAIEFLLWGQGLNGPGPGAGNRQATDYDTSKCTNGNCDRRRAYLRAATDLLVDDLAEITAAWKQGGAARAELMGKGADGGLTAILTGLGSLSYGELAGERIKLGVVLHDPEEAHDCFSDNTQNAHYFDQVGMMAIWNGRYLRADGKFVSGPSMADLARQKSAEAAKRLDNAMAVSLAKLQLVKNTADSGAMAYHTMLAAGNDAGNKMLLDASESIVAQARAVEGVVAALNLKIELEESKGLAKLEKEKTK
jgi:putative iron-regulated protein